MVRINLLTVKQVRESAKLYDVSNNVQTPQEARDVIESVLHLQDAAEEHFGILSLNTKNRVTGIHVLSVGSLNASIVHPREVFKAAILNNAASLICFHNHPSGDPTASPQDIELTRRLVNAGDLLGIEVLDHIIIGDGLFASMKQSGFFPQ